MKEFKDKVAVITGAASGIGFGLAERCAREGMKVVLADVEGGALEKAEEDIKATGAATLEVVPLVQLLRRLEQIGCPLWRVVALHGLVGKVHRRVHVLREAGELGLLLLALLHCAACRPAAVHVALPPLVGEVAGVFARLRPELSTGLGFKGIVVAWLGGLNPIGIIVSSVFFAGLLAGGVEIQIAGLPVTVIDMFNGSILFFVLLAEFFMRYKVEWRLLR